MGYIASCVTICQCHANGSIKGLMAFVRTAGETSKWGRFAHYVREVYSCINWQDALQCIGGNLTFTPLTFMTVWGRLLPHIFSTGFAGLLKGQQVWSSLSRLLAVCIIT